MAQYGTASGTCRMSYSWTSLQRALTNADVLSYSVTGQNTIKYPAPASNSMTFVAFQSSAFSQTITLSPAVAASYPVSFSVSAPVSVSVLLKDSYGTIIYQDTQTSYSTTLYSSQFPLTLAATASVPAGVQALPALVRSLSSAAASGVAVVFQPFQYNVFSAGGGLYSGLLSVSLASG